jgi:peroxiredoxin family protein
MEAFTSWMMKGTMAKLDIPPVSEFLELITAGGGKIYACKLAMDMFKFKKEDLSDLVSGVLTIGEFYEHAAGEGSQIIFT